MLLCMALEFEIFGIQEHRNRNEILDAAVIFGSLALTAFVIDDH